MTSKRTPLLVGVAVAGTALLTATALRAVGQGEAGSGRIGMAAGLTSSVTQNGIEVRASAATARVAAGGTVPLTVTLRSSTDQVAVVDLEAYGPTGHRAFQRAWTAQHLQAGRTSTWRHDWTVPSTPGRYRVVVCIFTGGWGPLLAWNNQAAYVVVAPSAPDGPSGADAPDDAAPGARPGTAQGSAAGLGRGSGSGATAGVGTGTGVPDALAIPDALVPRPDDTPVPLPAAPSRPAAAGVPGAAAPRATGARPSPGARPPAAAAPPPGAGHFVTLPAGAALPDGATCAGLVRAAPVPPEVRPANAEPDVTQGQPLAGATGLLQRVDGAFAGTTEQVLRWAACKWGIDEDVVKAQVAVQSGWRADLLGDWGSGDPSRCAPGHEPGADGREGSCPESFGLMQVRFPYHQIAFPGALTSSALGVDYAFAKWRDCYVGSMPWLDTLQHGSPYASGDAWGCVGVWYSGQWHTPAANDYIARVRAALGARMWASPEFAGR